MFFGKIKSVTQKIGSMNLFSGSGHVGEELVDRSLIQQRGFSSIPIKDDIFIGHRKGNLIICTGTIAQDEPKLEDSEAAMFIDSKTYIKVCKDGSIEIVSEKNKISIKGDLKIEGKLETTGNIESKGGITAVKDIASTAGGLSAGLEVTALAISPTAIKFSTHVHTSATPGSPTSPPTPGS